MPEKGLLYMYYGSLITVYMCCFLGHACSFSCGGVGLAYMLAWHTKQMKVWIWFCCCMPFFFIVFVLLAFYSKLFNLFLSLFLILQHLWAFFLVLPFEWMNQSNSVLDGFELWGLLWVVILNKISCG